MKLTRLSLTNFKGIKEFTLQADGQNVNIFGDNGTGKTTVADAFYFLLFGKDSLNRKEFEVLPLGAGGQRIQEIIQAEVEATFDIDGKEHTLKRIFSEKWTKKRGQSQKEFTGHVTDYFLDGVPVKQKEFDSAVAQIADTEDAFKLLTNPRYFCEVLPWQKRRELLLQICGDLTDEEIIASNEELADLPAILKGRSIEDHRRIIKGKHAEINKEIEKIPTRIDEVQLGLPDEQVEPADKKIIEVKHQLKEAQEAKARIAAGGEIAELIKAQRGIEADIQRMDNESGKSKDADVRKHQQAISDLQIHLGDLKGQIKTKQDTMKRNGVHIENIEGVLIDLRREWGELNAQEYTGNTNCPTCNQTLPADQIEAARAKWNLNKSKDLELIQKKGHLQRKEQEELKAKNETLAQEILSLNESIEATQTTIKDEQDSVAALQSEKESPNTERQAKLDELKTIIESITNLRRDNSNALSTAQAEINKVEQALGELLKIQSDAKRRKEGLKRIDELKAQNKELAKDYEELEHGLYLTDLFIQAKVALLESSINGRFSMANFKLFDKQVNGGIAECCEVTVDGIPYGAGLNNGARINAGLDIINTLAEHYGFAPVVFIDNAEAITQLMETTGQQVRLYVSEKDMGLRVELAG